MVKGPAARQQLRPVHDRHLLNRITPTSRRKAVNTVVLPDVDIAADLQAIQQGRAHWNIETQRYELPNGRVYGVEDAGTAFPVSGPGMVRLGRGEYQALQHYIQAGGDRQRAEAAMARVPDMSDDIKRRAYEVFTHHKSFRG